MPDEPKFARVFSSEAGYGVVAIGDIRISAAMNPEMAEQMADEINAAFDARVAKAVEGKDKAIANLVREREELRERWIKASDEKDRAVEAEREKNCLAVCPRCRKTEHFEPARIIDGQWAHLIKVEALGIRPCDAAAIRSQEGSVMSKSVVKRLKAQGALRSQEGKK